MDKIHNELNTDLKKASILIVDDELVNTLLLTKILESRGYTNIVSTQDPKQALPLYQKHSSDLVLLDLRSCFT